MKKTVLSVLALTALIYSCKKDSDKKSTRDQLLGKWNSITDIDNHHYDGKDHLDTTNYPIGYSTIEFKSNDSCIQYWNGYPDYSAYKIDGSNLIFIYTNESDTVTIKSLTDTELRTYSKEIISADKYNEHTDIAKKSN